MKLLSASTSVGRDTKVYIGIAVLGSGFRFQSSASVYGISM